MLCSLSKVSESQFPLLKQCLLETGIVRLTDLPFECLDVLRKTTPMQSTLSTASSSNELSCDQIEELRLLDKALSRTANDAAHLVLKILDLPDDALDYYYSEEDDKSLSTILKDVTNTVSTRANLSGGGALKLGDHQSKEEVLTLHFNQLSDSECTLRLGPLIETMLKGVSDLKNIRNTGLVSPRRSLPVNTVLKSDLAFHMNVKDCLTFMEFNDSFIFCPAAHRAHHDIYAGKRIPGLPDNLSYLCLVQAEVDAAIMYHLATSSLGEIEFEALRNRAAKSMTKLRVTMEHIHQINKLWGGDAYTIVAEYRYNRFCHFVSSKSLPSKAESRKFEFRQICLDYAKKNPLGLVPVNSSRTTVGTEENTDTESNRPQLKRRSSSQRVELMRKQPKLGFHATRAKPGSVLERIRKREQEEKAKIKVKTEAGEKQMGTDDDQSCKFGLSQLPLICKALLSLAPVSGAPKCFSKPQVLTKLSDSLRSKMSSLELHQVIDHIASKAPEFCTVVEVGPVSGIKLRPGWNMQRLSQLL